MESHMTSMDNVGHDCKKIFRTAFEGRADGICSRNSGSHLELVSSQRLWSLVYELVYALIQRAGWGGGVIEEPRRNAFGANQPNLRYVCVIWLIFLISHLRLIVVCFNKVQRTNTIKIHVLNKKTKLPFQILLHTQ